MNEVITARRENVVQRIEKINYLMLGITLFIALTASHLISDLIEWKVIAVAAEIEADELAKKLKAETALNEARMKREAENLAARNAEITRQQQQYQAEQRRIAEQNKIENEKIIQIQKTKRETCQFWINEYNKTHLTGDKYHRDNSCKEAGILF